MTTSSFPPVNSAKLLNTGLSIKEGDTKTIFRVQLLDVESKPVDLTDCTIKGYFSRPDNTYLFDKDIDIEDAPTGIISFHFTDKESTGTGEIDIQFNVIYQDSSIEKFPANDFVLINVEKSNDNITNFSSISFTTFADVQNQMIEQALTAVSSMHQAIEGKLDASETVTEATPNKLLYLNGAGKLPASITGNADGNAATASKLKTEKTIGVNGDATGNAIFDGSEDVAIDLTLSNSGVVAGEYVKVKVDEKGRVIEGMDIDEDDIPNLSWSKITNTPILNYIPSPASVSVTKEEFDLLRTELISKGFMQSKPNQPDNLSISTINDSSINLIWD